MNEFLKEHAEIRVELNLSDQIVPLLDERLDLALRIGHLPDSAMVARQIGSTRLVTCASPDYLSTAPAIDTPAALKDHACIAFAAQGRHWYYRHGEKEQAEEITPRLTCNQIRTASLACVKGLGITRLMHYQIADELADGRLVRVLRGLRTEGPADPTRLPARLAAIAKGAGICGVGLSEIGEGFAGVGLGW